MRSSNVKVVGAFGIIADIDENDLPQPGRAEHMRRSSANLTHYYGLILLLSSLVFYVSTGRASEGASEQASSRRDRDTAKHMGF